MGQIAAFVCVLIDLLNASPHVGSEPHHSTGHSIENQLRDFH